MRWFLADRSNLLSPALVIAGAVLLGHALTTAVGIAVGVVGGAVFIWRIVLSPKLVADGHGVLLVHPVGRHRFAWEAIREIRLYEPTRRKLLKENIAGHLSIDGITIQVSWGIGAAGRRDLLARLGEIGARFGLDALCGTDEEIQAQVEANEPPPPAPRDPADWERAIRVQAPGNVRCAICGRVAGGSEMEPFGMEAEEPAWYCRDDRGCQARVASGRAGHGVD